MNVFVYDNRRIACIKIRIGTLSFLSYTSYTFLDKYLKKTWTLSRGGEKYGVKYRSLPWPFLFKI